MYFDDLPHQHLVGFDFEADGKHASIEEGWRYYQARPFTSGLFYWTGFDYRGETTPFGYPAISSQFGLLDTCGFMKDTAFAAQSFWTDAKTQPMVHLATTWTLPNKVQHGGLGESIPVLVYSNASSVELSLNGKLLGKKQMPENSHLEWQVPYEPGTLLATAYNAAGIEIAHDKVETVAAPAEIHLDPSKSTLAADGTSLSLIAVRVDDARHRMVPDASNLISFTLTGPGRILGVGNGDPASHEPDQFLPAYASIPVVNWHTRAVDSLKPGPETAPAFDDSGWAKAEDPRWDEKPNPPAVSVFRGSFTVPDVEANATLTLLFAPVGDSQSFYLNGQPLVETMPHTLANYPYTVPAGLLHPGKNIITIYATRFTEKNGSDKHWTWSHGGPVTVAAALPAPQWQRSVFNGLAQIIVQSTGQPGEITLTATSPNLTPAKLTIPTH
jgi:beta-galactosidase